MVCAVLKLKTYILVAVYEIRLAEIKKGANHAIRSFYIYTVNIKA